MKKNLKHLILDDFTTQNNTKFKELPLSYQTFGRKLGTAPIVLINHALTGNSNVAGENGWWNSIIGSEKVINTQRYTILCFNIPGNGYDGFLIENYKCFVARDVANVFLKGLEQLQIKSVFALIGGSLGGGIAWEMLCISPNLTKHFIPIATDWKSTDWLIANCQIQEQFLVNSKAPVHDARMHAMLCYRTPKSFKNRFKRSVNQELEIFNVESWLLHHGKKLQDRFQLSAYKLMNQLLKTIDVTKGRSEEVLKTIQANVHIIGVNSDLFFTAEENRETFKKLAQSKEYVTYNEIYSEHGHDAFLIEYDQLEEIITPIFNKNDQHKMKVIKFGGKSLTNGTGISAVTNIIKNKVKDNNSITVVVSARGNATDKLENILEKASKNEEYQSDFEEFKEEQLVAGNLIDLSEEFNKLQKIFNGVSLLNDYSPKIKDKVLAFGELLSAKTVAAILQKEGINAIAVDARMFFITDSNFGNAQILPVQTGERVTNYFKNLSKKSVPIVTGFIASNIKGETTTLGRNGSNYSAALLANYLDAEELQNYTHVNGIYTANPNLVEDAQKIKELTFNQANEMAHFGASILHAKTIVPLLEKNINLRILNTFNAEDEGTLITGKTSSKSGIKSLPVIEDVSLIHFEGRGLLGKVGVDARIFGALHRENISVSIISQGSSERGIGFVVNVNDAKNAVKVLEQEFEQDFYTKDVSAITIDNDIAVISLIGLDLSEFHLPFSSLIKNQIVPLLFNNTLTGENVSLVVKKQQLNKALNVIHGQVFGVAKKINIAIFGVGLVGGTLVNQILESATSILERRNIQLNIFCVANSKKVVLCKNGIKSNWADDLRKGQENYTVQSVIDFAKQHHLENLIAIDNTASKDFVENYVLLIKAGFDLVSSNKVANTNSFNFYQKLRKKLAENNRTYLYETNVGAGLPLIDTIGLLHDSGENITKIRGVFSGSLSYLFNTFSSEAIPFSKVLQQAIDNGYTEPDPREDLCGNDVARKLLILARELELENEFEDISIENLIPKALQKGSVNDFLKKIDELNVIYREKKTALKENYVLRYVGELGGDLFGKKGKLEVKLVSVLKNSPLGSLKGSDAIFEIFTESYGDQPIVIQGAGAGASVTARGVLGDVLRLAKSNN